MTRLLTSKVCASDLLPGELSLFPTESSQSVSFTQEELLEMSGHYSQLYYDLVESLSYEVTKHLAIPKDVSKSLIRSVAVPLTHFFMDRLIRLNRFLNLYGHEDIAVAAVTAMVFPAGIEHFRGLASSSYDFNQSLLCRLAPIFDLQVLPLIPPASGEKTEKEQARPPLKFVNHNFSQSRWQKMQRAIFWLPFKLLSRVWPQLAGRIPVISLGYAGPVLQAKRFYGFSGFADLSRSVDFERFSVDRAFRKKILLTAIANTHSSLDRFLNQVGFKEKSLRDRVMASFQSYMMDFYPSNLLEGLCVNLQKCVKPLRRLRSRVIITIDHGDTETLYFFAAAKFLGMKTIGCQHGGHEGYEDDYVSNEMQYPVFDYFVSWGWRRFPETPAINGLKAIPLPAPWFTARRQQWHKRLKKYDDDVVRSYDLLLAPNKIYHYPVAPSGASISRVDHMHRFSESLKEIVEKAAAEQVRILHKPCNRATTQLLAGTMKELERLGGPYYHCIEQLDKGLTSDFLNQCHLVLWDQPGTGFLECLVSNIPTMIYWPRIYNQEVPWARPIFKELESVGIVHSHANTVFSEYKKFKSSPKVWMSDPHRLDVVARFCREYVWTDNRWPKYWRQFLRSIPQL